MTEAKEKKKVWEKRMRCCDENNHLESWSAVEGEWQKFSGESKRLKTNVIVGKKAVFHSSNISKVYRGEFNRKCK